MTNNPQKTYVPGMYKGRFKNGASPAEIAEKCLRQWEKKRKAGTQKGNKGDKINYSICFSRKIGVGALEIADLVAARTGLQVVDREILEHIANDHELGRKTVDFFDERHPGLMNDFGAMLFGEKSLTLEDYMRHLLASVYALVEDCPTLFVGRAAHLMLPRDRILAVRIISSKGYRVKRIADIMGIDEAEAAKKLDEEERRQREFFSKNLRKKDASPYEFDLVINRDYLTEAEWAADLVARAYKIKFRMG